MNQIIVNFASHGREDYLAGQRRLAHSLRQQGFDGTYRFYTKSLPAGCPDHQKVPYAFKWYGMREAFKEGKGLVLWLDASVVARKPLDPMWGIIEKQGVLVFDNPGCMENYFTSEDCLKKIGCSLEEAQHITQICGGAIGFNSSCPEAQFILSKMIEFAEDGVSFQGGSNKSSDPRFISHRHDQSCLSYLIHKREIKKLPFDWLRYTYDARGLEGAILELRGM